MIQQKNLLVNGCSFSRGPNSWPYFLSNVNLVNLAQAGAGNTYIHETTIAELSQRKYDLVIVMWTGIPRIDFKVNDINFSIYFHEIVRCYINILNSFNLV